MLEDFDTFLSKMKLLGDSIDFSITLKREMILKTLFEAKSPLNAKNISKIIKDSHSLDISITSIYKFLNILEEVYILHAIVLPPNNTKYYSLIGYKAQSHLVCTKCEKILTFSDDETLELLDRVLDKEGFTLSNLKVTLYGICKECMNE